MGRRGLVVPQNTFLENIIRRSNGLHPNFILGNAQLSENPIVYCSDGFVALTGFNRKDIMSKNCNCSFMYGDLTEKRVKMDFNDALLRKQALQTEIICYRSDGKPMWFLLHIGPINNEKGEVLLFLITVKDISEYKSPIPGTQESGAKGWARLNKSLTSHKSVLVAFKQKTASQRNAQQISHLMALNDDLLPDYKQEVPSTPPRIILHYTTFKLTWDWVILILTLYTTVSVPFIVCFAYTGTILAWMDMMVDWMFLADIVLNFHTTYVNKEGDVINDPKMIRMNYIKSWFFVDLVSSLPYGIIFLASKTDDSAITTLLGMLKVFRLLRLGRVARKIDKYLEYGASTFFLLQLTFCLVAHWMACLWYVIAYEYDKTNPAGWLQHMANSTHQSYGFKNNTYELDPDTGPTLASKYVSALYYCLSSLTTCGFGNIAPNTTAEKLFGCITMLLGSILYALIFGQVSTILQQAQKQTAKYHAIIDNMKMFSKLYKVPQRLGDRIVDYFMSTWAINKGVDTDEVLKYCPKDLQADICVHLNRVILENNPAFHKASIGALRAIARNFWICHVAPGDRVVHTGESLDVLYFIAKGSLEVKQNEAVVGLLGEGHVFGDNICHEPSIGQSAVDVYALTYCDMHCIHRDALLEVLEFYPDFALKFASTLNLSYNLRDELKLKRKVSMTPRVEIHNEDEELPPLSTSFGRRRVRKLSLVQELIQTYDIDESHLDGAGPSSLGAKNAGYQDEDIEMLVIPDGRKSPGKSRSLRSAAAIDNVDGNIPSTEVLTSMSEMKGEVRREMESMNMKMSQLEQQIGTILDILKSQGHLNSRAGGSDGDSTHSADSNLTGELPDSNIKESPVHVRCPREKQQNLEKNPSRYNDLNLNTKPEKEKNDDALPHWLAPPGSATSHHSHQSIPDWEEAHASDKKDDAANAARMLNENKPSSPDPRIFQTLNLIKRK